MINLLPPELKQQYVYGRRNTTLRRWSFAMVFGLFGVAAVTFAGLFLMEKSITTYRHQVTTTNTLLSQEKLEQTREHTTEITSSVKLAVDVLSKEVLFSKLITQIGKVTPSNTRLTGLTLGKDLASIEIKAVSSDYTSATQLQINLQDPANQIFDKADIQTITCQSSVTDPRYPCAITIKALFNQNTPYLFINKNGAKNK